MEVRFSFAWTSHIFCMFLAVCLHSLIQSSSFMDLLATVYRIYFFHRCQLCYKSKSDDVCRFACSLFYYQLLLSKKHGTFWQSFPWILVVQKCIQRSQQFFLSNGTSPLNSRFEKNQLKLMKNHFTPWFDPSIEGPGFENCTIGTLRRQGQLILLTVFHWRTQSIHSSDVFNPWGHLDVI